MVSHGGTSYMCISNVTGTTTPNADTSNWDTMAGKGDIGVTGAQGTTGNTGSQGPIGNTGPSGFPSGGAPGQVVTNTSSGAGNWQDAAGGGALTLISSTVPTLGASAVTITGITGYDSYFVNMTDISGGTAGAEHMEIRFGDSSGIKTSADYAYHNMRQNPGVDTFFAYTSTSVSNAVITSEAHNMSGLDTHFWLSNTGSRVWFTGHGSYENGGGSEPRASVISGGWMGATFTCDRFKINLTGGATSFRAVGKIDVYGVSN
jgi:hypothetical protein